MPRPIDANSQVVNTVDRGTNFIIEDESWKMIEADFTSASGIIYMSLTENKVNMEYDDLEADIADTDKLLFPTLEPVYVVGEEIVPNFTEQTLNEWEVVLSFPTESTCIGRNDNGHLVALAAGNEVIEMRLKNYDSEDPRRAVVKKYSITINATSEDAPLYIYGPDKVRLDRYANYSLVAEGAEDVNLVDVIMSITSGEEYGDLSKDEEKDMYVLHANKNNKLGKIVLEATYNNKQYSKTVEITPLW